MELDEEVKAVDISDCSMAIVDNYKVIKLPHISHDSTETSDASSNGSLTKQNDPDRDTDA